MNPTFLITGATGQQGGAAARHLLEENANVHALVRDPSSPAAQALKEAGAILFKGDFDDVPAIKKAMSGVSGLFLNPFLGAKQVEQAQNFVDAALASGTVRTVALSTAYFTSTRALWSSDLTSGLYQYYTDKLAIETLVKGAGFENYTILRPGWLFHNYLVPASAYHFPQLATKGILGHMYSPETRMSHFAADDVGKFAAAALLEPEKFKGHEIELGNENLTIEEVRSRLSKASGVEIVSHRYTPEDIEKYKGKIPTLGFHKLAEENDLTLDGNLLEEKYGIKFMTFEEFLEKHKELLIESPLKQK
ncbi:hypothetical protein G7Y89_g14324 [Cudoniella acicularis]|uniref:NmrA-like domain-containing protein n=1 Tax=Cudoniella acicularis TaxID=354080 RepID=A0A8H4R4E2_9HELO|nr:hypothetical protein G7Y89_g14324 [Cudoniella acicularis]